MRFDRFMDIALYGEHGFYSAGGRAGRRGDFLTSPEVGPLFGVLVARWIDAEHRRLGAPTPFTVVEAGAGPGTLARGVLAAWGASGRDAPHRYVTVEVSAAQRALHPEGVTALAELPPGPLDGVVVANELLDNLPFRLLVFDGGWREAHVAVDGRRLVEVLHPLADPPAFLPDRAPHGARVPWQQAARAWVETAQSLLRTGTVLTLDYTTPTTAGLARRPWREWLRTYGGHQRGGHYLARPGDQDITAEVALDQLPEPAAVRTQEQLLRLLGIDELVDEGREAWRAAAGAPTLAAMAMRSRVREAEALLDPDGLGGFTAVVHPGAAPEHNGGR